MENAINFSQKDYCDIVTINNETVPIPIRNSKLLRAIAEEEEILKINNLPIEKQDIVNEVVKYYDYISMYNAIAVALKATEEMHCLGVTSDALAIIDKLKGHVVYRECKLGFNIHKIIEGMHYLDILNDYLQIIDKLKENTTCHEYNFAISEIIYQYLGPYETTKVAKYVSLTIHDFDARDPNITDELLKNIKGIKKLDASDNRNITTVEPFSETLEELKAKYDCGIDSKGLAMATNLRELDISYNEKVSKKEFEGKVEKLVAYRLDPAVRGIHDGWRKVAVKEFKGKFKN